MSLSINTNLASLSVQRQLVDSQAAVQKTMQKLSSGNRINSAADDAAGLAIATRLDSQIRGMGAAAKNINDGVSSFQVADAALSNVNDSLQRMRELAVQASSASTSASDQTAMNAEYQQLGTEVTRTLANTDYNGSKLLAGGAGAKTFQIGANGGDTVSVTTTNMSTQADIVATTGGDLTSAANATTAIGNLDKAMAAVNTERSTYGASTSRFEAMASGLATQSESLQAAKSRIMDTDYAAETANLAKQQIKQQAAAAMLAQANQTPQLVMSLLR